MKNRKEIYLLQACQAASKTGRFVYFLFSLVFGPVQCAECLHVSKNNEVGSIFSTARVMVSKAELCWLEKCSEKSLILAYLMWHLAHLRVAPFLRQCSQCSFWPRFTSASMSGRRNPRSPVLSLAPRWRLPPLQQIYKIWYSLLCYHPVKNKFTWTRRRSNENSKYWFVPMHCSWLTLQSSLCSLNHSQI